MASSATQLAAPLPWHDIHCQFRNWRNSSQPLSARHSDLASCNPIGCSLDYRVVLKRKAESGHSLCCAVDCDPVRRAPMMDTSEDGSEFTCHLRDWCCTVLTLLCKIASETGLEETKSVGLKRKLDALSNGGATVRRHNILLDWSCFHASSLQDDGPPAKKAKVRVPAVVTCSVAHYLLVSVQEESKKVKVWRKQVVRC